MTLCLKNIIYLRKILLTIRLFVLFVLSMVLAGCANITNSFKSIKKEDIEEKRVVTRTAISTLENIVVMLPLKDKSELAATSQAIYNGILAAHYSESPQQANLKIKIIDTADSNGNVSELYNKAILDGAELVIGPLTKAEVESISNGKTLPVPTIALNTLDNYQHVVINNLYQFGLLPQDEAVQVAMKLSQENLNKVAIVAPEGAWGDKIITAFERQYVLSGGKIIATLKYSNTHDQDLADSVCHFLANDPDKLCESSKLNKKKNKDSNEVMRRQDIDSIFLIAANPSQAKQIVPLLKFYYANDLPIYSISTIYTGYTGYNSDAAKKDLSQDLDNIYFCDSLWNLGGIGNINSLSAKLQGIYNKILTTAMWKDSFIKYSKFYALGVDAYNLAVHLNDLLGAPQVGFAGASGTLYLDNFNHIYRQLHWTQIK